MDTVVVAGATGYLGATSWQNSPRAGTAFEPWFGHAPGRSNPEATQHHR